MIRITVPGVPPSLNRFAGRKNEWEYRATKRKWTDAVCWEVKRSGAAIPEPYPLAKVTITYYFPTAGRHDADNYAGKFLLDGLTRAGVIVDDDLKHIRTEIRGDVDRKDPRTVIEVIEVMTANAGRRGSG